MPTLLIERDENHKNLFILGDASCIFASMVFCGFLFLGLVQTLGVLFGDHAPIQVRILFK